MTIDELRITEIFYSLQGEAATVGYPTTFVRLTGCPLRCQYCDTEYAFSGGQKMSFKDIFDKVLQYPTRYVCVTGGEPLAQPSCIPFLEHLVKKNFMVSLETSGAFDVRNVPADVCKVVDIKTPDSLEMSKNLYDNLDFLTSKDCIKFVICSNKDYEWAKDIVSEFKLQEKAQVFFSPSAEQLSATQLADWVLHDRIQVRVQVQLHKILWGDVQGK